MEYQSPDPYIEERGALYQCNLCALALNSKQQVQNHIDGSNHKSRLNKVKLVPHQTEANMHSTEQKLSAFNLTAESNLPQYVEKHGFGYKCVCCEIPLNSNSQIMNHVAGTKHKKKAASFNEQYSVSSKQTKMEVENFGQPANDHKNIEISASVYNSVNASVSSNANLPPYIEVFGDQYKCKCCVSMLNSYSQINSHVHGAKHVKAKLFYDANPELRDVKSDNENLIETKNMEESFDLYSDLEKIKSDELMKNIKIFNATENIVF